MKPALFVFALLISGSSFAANEVPLSPSSPTKENANLIASCKPDVDKFCKGIEAGAGRIVECLKKHKDELSAACKVAAEEKREDFKKKRAEIRDACHEDAETLCKGIHGPKNRVGCLKEHHDQLSAECKKVLPSR
jgi:hypothetical protein